MAIDNNNNNITSMALKSSEARAQKRNKTKSVIIFKSRGHTEGSSSVLWLVRLLSIENFLELCKVRTCHNFVGGTVFFKRKSVSIRIIHQCIDVSRHFARDSHRDAVCKKIRILRNKIKITILLLSSIHCNITLMFPFVCNICNAISYAT